MKSTQIDALLEKQRSFFATGATLDVKYRISALKKLHQALVDSEAAIARALKEDLGKSAEESYMCETGMVLSEIRHMLGHIRSYAREETVPTPLAQFAARSYRKPTPYGVCLIMSPWNYPILLTLDPLVDALAAGNTVIIKPSAYSPATSNLLADLLGKLFPSEYVAVVTGGREENSYLLDQKFDCIFFTGSKTVGRLVLEKAAPHLTPVTLELGGKSPCIVDSTAKIPLAARRIAFGKFLNCGQTCVAPDYILCHESVKDQLIDCLKCIQHDKTNPNDVAKQPHEITHGPDALRYFAQTYVLPGEKEVEEEVYEDDVDVKHDYFTEMCGTGVSDSYILA